MAQAPNPDAPWQRPTGAPTFTPGSAPVYPTSPPASSAPTVDPTRAYPVGQPQAAAYQPPPPGYPPAQPGYPQQPPPYLPGGGGPVAPRSRRTGPIIAIIVVLVLLFCGGTATAGYLLYAAGTDDEPTTSRTPGTQTTAQPTVEPTTAPQETDEPTAGPSLPGFPGGGAKAIVYEVTGEGTANLFYSTPDGGKNESNVSLPWRKEFTAPEGTGLVTVTATRTDASGEGLACRILVDGKEATSNEGGIISALCIAPLF